MYRCTPLCKRYAQKEDCPYYSYKYDYEKNITIEYCSRSKTRNFFSLLKHSQEYLRYYVLNKLREEKEKYLAQEFPKHSAKTAASSSESAAQPKVSTHKSATAQTKSDSSSAAPNITEVYRPSFSDKETILSKFIALLTEQYKTIQILAEKDLSPANINSTQQQIDFIMQLMQKIIAGDKESEKLLATLLQFPTPKNK